MKNALVLTSLALAITTSSAAVAEETIRLTTVSGYPATASWVDLFEEVLVPEVNSRLAKTGNYKIDWTYGWGGSIVGVKGELEALEVGLADIGIVPTMFHPDRLRIYDIAYATPFVSTDIDLISDTVNELSEQFPAMKQAWVNNNQHMLTTLGAVDNYQLFLKGDYTGMDSLSGKKIGGAAMNLRYVEHLGVTGVSSTLGEFYNGVATGIYDGALVWATAAESFKIYEAAPTIVKADFGGVSSMALTLNLQAWEALPDEVKGVLEASAEIYREELAAYSINEAEQALDKMLANGADLIRVPEEERIVWAEGMDNIAAEWAQEVTDMGAPGDEILSAYIHSMQEAGQPVLRDWAEN